MLGWIQLSIVSKMSKGTKEIVIVVGVKNKLYFKHKENLLPKDNFMHKEVYIMINNSRRGCLDRVNNNTTRKSLTNQKRTRNVISANNCFLKTHIHVQSAMLCSTGSDVFH